MPERDSQAVIDQLVSMFDHLDELAPPVHLDELNDWPGSDQMSSPSMSTVVGFRRRRQLVGIAAACVAVVGMAGVWWAIDRDSSPGSLDPADTAVPTGNTVSAATEPGLTTVPQLGVNSVPNDNTTSTAADASLVDRIATLGPWDAARLFQVDAQYRASPVQAADLTIANELKSRDCYQQQGIDIAAFDPNRLAEWEQYEQNRWDRRRRLWTPDGQQELRQTGNSIFRDLFLDEPVVYPHATTPEPQQCYPAATGVTFLGGTVVWSEEQLDSALMDGDREWAPVTWAFGRLPGTEDAKRMSDECMIALGWDQWTQLGGAYQSLYTQPEVSDTEIDQMGDLVECNQQADASAVYLTASADYVREFRLRFAGELDRIANERADALAEAYDVLRAAGLDPLSD